MCVCVCVCVCPWWALFDNLLSPRSRSEIVQQVLFCPFKKFSFLEKRENGRIGLNSVYILFPFFPLSSFLIYTSYTFDIHPHMLHLPSHHLVQSFFFLVFLLLLLLLLLLFSWIGGLISISTFKKSLLSTNKEEFF